MIQSAKDLFIPSINLTSARKENKNSVASEEFASVLKTEDSRFDTKTSPVDAEKPVFIDNTISPERKLDVSSENYTTDFVEELTSSIDSAFEKVKENIDVNDDDSFNLDFQMIAPFAIAEDLSSNFVNNLSTDSSSVLTNSQEYGISNASYPDIMTNYKEYPVPFSPDGAFYENVSGLSALYERPTTNEQSSVDRNLPFPVSVQDPKIDDKSALVNTMALLTKDGIIDHKEVVLHESFILGYEEDEGVGLNALKSENPDKSLFTNDKSDINISDQKDAENPVFADLNPKMGKVPVKRDQKIAVKPNEKASESSTDKVHEKTKEEIIEPLKALETEKNVPPKTINDGINIPGIDADEIDHKDNSGKQNNSSFGKELSISDNNDLDKVSVENRQEFNDFTHRINEQRSLLNNDFTKSLANPQQMNLINKGRFAFSESINNIVRFIRSGESTKAVLIVDPPDLGRVNIEIASTDNGIEAVLKVSNEQIKTLVLDQAVQLKLSLAEIGVNLSEFTVDIQQDDSRSRNQSFSGQGKKKRARFGDAEDENKPERIETFRVDLRKGFLHWVA